MAKKKKKKNTTTQKKTVKKTEELQPQAPIPPRPTESQFDINAALADENLKPIYFNGFANAAGTGDMMTVLVRNNKPVAVLNASHTTMKTLAMKLGYLLAQLEQKTGNRIMTIDEIQQKLSEEGGDGDTK